MICMHKALFLCTKYNGCLEEKHLCNWVMSWISPILSMEHHFTWKETDGKTMIIQIWQTYSKKTNEMSLLLQKKPQATTVFELFSENQNIEKLLSTIISLREEVFLMRLGVIFVVFCTVSTFLRSAKLRNQCFPMTNA